MVGCGVLAGGWLVGWCGWVVVVGGGGGGYALADRWVMSNGPHIESRVSGASHKIQAKNHVYILRMPIYLGVHPRPRPSKKHLAS